MNTNLQHRSGELATQSIGQLDYLLLDGSSSMTSMWENVLASLDTYVETLRSERINTLVRFATFAGRSPNDLIVECSPDEWLGLRGFPLPNGLTPLYDAIAFVGRELRDLNPTRCSLVIATDGDEAGSTHTDLTQAKAILKWMEAKGWNVTFIGCDFDNSKLAASLGVRASQAIGVSRARLSDATKTLAKKRVNNARTGAPMHWTDDEKEQFGGYLGHG